MAADANAIKVQGPDTIGNPLPVGVIKYSGGIGSSDGINNGAVLGNLADNNAGAVALGAPLSFNGSTWDRQRGNVETTLLASASRTATVSSADQTNYNGRGVQVDIDITSA